MNVYICYTNEVLIRARNETEAKEAYIEYMQGIELELDDIEIEEVTEQ